MTRATRAGWRAGDRIRNALYVLPAAVLLVALVYFSLGYTVWLSFYEWNGVGPDRRFVGLDNYARALADPVFWRALGNVALFLCLVVVQLLLGFVFALLLNSRLRLGVIYRVIVFVPVVLAPASMAPVFQEIFAPRGGLNTLLDAVGLGSLAHPWLADPATAIFALALINVWSWTGFSFMLYYAGLTHIDPSVIEAARIDGASNLRIARSVILPMMKPTTLVLLVLGTIGTIKVFDIPQIITQGGPANSTQFIATYMYQQGIRNYAAGYAASITVMMVVACIVLAVLQLRLNRRAAA